MRKNAIPPHVGIKGRINEKFPPLDKINVRINRTMIPFVARGGGDGKRRVLLNNFNATVSYAQEQKLHVKLSIATGRQHKSSNRRCSEN